MKIVVTIGKELGKHLQIFLSGDKNCTITGIML